jgi:hypothetical protein
MTQRVDLILAEVRKLTPDEREMLLMRLHHELIDDDDDGEPAEGTPEEIEAAWLEEVQRRVAAAERGETTFVDHEEGMAEIRRMIRDAS